MHDYRDIVIAGGGMVGISLALQLARLLPRDRSIMLVEGFPLPQPDDAPGAAYHPSFDARSTALSYSSRLIYEQIGVWSALQPWLCPIESIHVSSRRRFGSTLLRAAQHRWDALGYVVENAWLGRSLAGALLAQGVVETRSPARVVAARRDRGGVELEIQGASHTAMRAALLVIADGANSGLCAQLGMAVQTRPSGQYALVANVSTAEHHGGCAFERFTDEGPLALLPLLPATAGENRSALVWTLPPERAAALGEIADDAFLQALQDRFGYRLGRLLRVGERHTYPLALTRAVEQMRQGVVVMGNAAHTLHPVAGQGYNLALRDVAELGRALALGVAAGESPGDLTLLRRYQQSQESDQNRTIDFSEQLPTLFMRNDPVLGIGRDLALSGLDLIPALKHEFVRYAAGVAAHRGAADG